MSTYASFIRLDSTATFSLRQTCSRGEFFFVFVFQVVYVAPIDLEFLRINETPVLLPLLCLCVKYTKHLSTPWPVMSSLRRVHDVKYDDRVIGARSKWKNCFIQIKTDSRTRLSPANESLPLSCVLHRFAWRTASRLSKRQQPLR